MNELIKKNIQVAKVARQKGASKKEDFSGPLAFAGEEFNQELENSVPIPPENIIDFDQEGNNSAAFLESKIKEIYNLAKNQQTIQSGDLPLIFFKNIDKITNKNLEEALLPIFDPKQNTDLFGSDKIDLSQFILVATTSTSDLGKISNHLISRLDFLNVDTAQPKKFFLDKHFGTILTISLLLSFLLLILIVGPAKKIKNKLKH